MRKKLFSRLLALITATMLIGGVSYGQYRDMGDYMWVDTVLNFKTDNTNLYMKPVSASWKHYFAFTNFNVNYESDTATVYLINTQNYQIDTLRFFVPNLRKSIKAHRSTQFKALTMNDNQLVVLDWRTAFLFENKDGQWTFSKNVKIDIQYQLARLMPDGTLLLEECYDRTKLPVSITLFDLNKEKVIKQIEPYYNTPLLSYIGRYEMFDYNYNTLLLCNSNDYSFYLFDEQLNLTDSVRHPNIKWTPLSKETLARVNAVKKHYAANKIEILIEAYNNIDVLIGSYFLDKDHILIARQPVWKQPFRPTIYDVWTRINGKWTPTLENIEDNLKKPDFQRNHITLGLGHGQLINIAGDKIVRLATIGTVDNPIGLSNEEYDKKSKEYLMENDPFVQIYIFSHQLTQQ